MRHRIVHAHARALSRTVAGLAAAAFLAAAAGAAAQTLTDPNPPPRLPVPPGVTAAKPPAVGRTKSCSQFGDGFVYVPASDTCVKVGGYVRFDAGANTGH